MATVRRTFTLKIDCDNDAFQPDACDELAKILRHIADNIDSCNGNDDQNIAYYQTVFDVNGNDVGRYALKARR
jgi:hypothetical protein